MQTTTSPSSITDAWRSTVSPINFDLLRQDWHAGLLALSAFLWLAATAWAGSPTTQISRVEFLEKEGHWEEARDVLAGEVLPSYDIGALRQWLDFDTKWAARLPSSSQNAAITSFQPQTTAPTTASIISGGALIGGSTDLPWWVQSLGQLGLKEETRRALVSREEANPLAEVSIGDTKKVLDEFEHLKTSENRLHQMLSSALKDGPEAQLADYNDLYKTQAELLDSIVTARTNYLSFGVVSPNLARAEQLIYLSDLKEPIWGHDKDLLAKAAKDIAEVCDQGLLLETDKKVRDQFLKVYKSFKQMAGAEEMEDLKVLQTLSDTIVTEKQKGADRWKNE